MCIFGYVCFLFLLEWLWTCFQERFEVMVGCKFGLSIIFSLSKVMSFIIFSFSTSVGMFLTQIPLKRLLRRLCAVITLQNGAYDPHSFLPFNRKVVNLQYVGGWCNKRAHVLEGALFTHLILLWCSSRSVTRGTTVVLSYASFPTPRSSSFLSICKILYHCKTGHEFCRKDAQWDGRWTWNTSTQVKSGCEVDATHWYWTVSLCLCLYLCLSVIYNGKQIFTFPAGLACFSS